MLAFSYISDCEQNIGELVLEALLSSNIDSIIDLDLGSNTSWFKHPYTQEERSDCVDLLVELISKQTDLKQLNLSYNLFTSNAT